MHKEKMKIFPNSFKKHFKFSRNMEEKMRI